MMKEVKTLKELMEELERVYKEHGDMKLQAYDEEGRFQVMDFMFDIDEYKDHKELIVDFR